MLEAGERKLERADVHGFLSAIHDRYGYDLRGYAPPRPRRWFLMRVRSLSRFTRR